MRLLLWLANLVRGLFLLVFMIGVLIVYGVGRLVLWIGVRDVGRGIAPDDQALVFRRAWRDGAPTAEGDGHGLGLALVRQIAEAHGGTVSVASAPGHGASFVVWLPDRTADAKVVPASDLRAMADPLWAVDATS